MYGCVYASIFTHTHVYTDIHKDMYIYIYIYTYVDVLIDVCIVCVCKHMAICLCMQLLAACPRCIGRNDGQGIHFLLLAYTIFCSIYSVLFH